MKDEQPMKYQCLDCLQEFVKRRQCVNHASRNHMYIPGTPYDKPRFIIIGGDGRVFTPEELK